MGCLEVKSSKEFVFNLFSNENFPELRQLTMNDLKYIFNKEKNNEEDLPLSIQIDSTLSKEEWEDICQTRFFQNRDNSNKKARRQTEIQKEIMMKIYFSASYLQNGRQTKEYIQVFLFPFLDHKGEAIEVNLMNLFDLLKNSYIKSKEYNQSQVNHIHFNKLNIVLLDYLCNSIKGISHFVKEEFYLRRHILSGSLFEENYDFERVDEINDIMNIKKFFFYVNSELFCNVQEKFNKGLSMSLNEYNVDADDFVLSFRSKDFLVRFEDMVENFNFFILNGKENGKEK